MSKEELPLMVGKSQVPMYLLEKICGWPGGIRLPKRVLYTPEIKPAAPVANEYGRRSMETGGATELDYFRSLDLKACLGFDFEEFRFWAVKMDPNDDEPQLAVCRYCESECVTREARISHKEEMEKDDLAQMACTKVLTAAYQLLLKDSKCVVCDQRTIGRKWGIPLCQTGPCVRTWCYDVQPPNALISAILLVPNGMNGLKAKETK